MVASVCPHWASWELRLLLLGTRAVLCHVEGCSSLGLSQPPMLGHLASAQGWPACVWQRDASAGLGRGDLPGGGWPVAWAPLPSAVSGGQQPGRMTRQVPTALFIVWSLARLELDTVVLVRVHWALACGTACLPRPPGAPLPGLSPASRSRGLRMVTWWLGFRRHLTSSLTPRALLACCLGLFPDSLGRAIQAVG